MRRLNVIINHIHAVTLGLSSTPWLELTRTCSLKKIFFSLVNNNLEESWHWDANEQTLAKCKRVGIYCPETTCMDVLLYEVDLMGHWLMMTWEGRIRRGYVRILYGFLVSYMFVIIFFQTIPHRPPCRLAFQFQYFLFLPSDLFWSYVNKSLRLNAAFSFCLLPAALRRWTPTAFISSLNYKCFHMINSVI